MGTPAAAEGDQGAQAPEGPHEFQDLTQKTGTLPGTYTTKMEANAQSVVHTARRLPVALKEKAINELNEMKADTYIVKVFSNSPSWSRKADFSKSSLTKPLHCSSANQGSDAGRNRGSHSYYGWHFNRKIKH